MCVNNILFSNLITFVNFLIIKLATVHAINTYIYFDNLVIYKTSIVEALIIVKCKRYNYVYVQPIPIILIICISYNMGKRDLPDIYGLARGSQAQGHGYIAISDSPCY